MKPRGTHSSFARGKRVYVKMREGGSFIRRFKEKKSGVVHFLEGGKVKMAAVKSITIYRQGDV